MSDTSSHTNGLGFDTLPSLISTNVLVVQHSRSSCLRGSCKPTTAKSDEVRGRKKVSIDIRPKKFGKDVQVIDSSHRHSSQVSLLCTLKGAAQRTLNKSQILLDLKATSGSRSTSNRFVTSCTIGTRYALSAYSGS
jgi:hypothetical protein